jgi:hypothetical protein
MTMTVRYQQTVAIQNHFTLLLEITFSHQYHPPSNDIVMSYLKCRTYYSGFILMVTTGGLLINYYVRATVNFCVRHRGRKTANSESKQQKPWTSHESVMSPVLSVIRRMKKIGTNRRDWTSQRFESSQSSQACLGSIGSVLLAGIVYDRPLISGVDIIYLLTGTFVASHNC